MQMNVLILSTHVYFRDFPGVTKLYFHCLLHPEEAEWRNVGVLNENIISCWCCINLLKFCKGTEIQFDTSVDIRR